MLEHSSEESILKMIGVSSVMAALGWIWGRMTRTPRPTGHLTLAEVVKLLAEHSESVKDSAYFEKRIYDIEKMADERHGELLATIEGMDNRMADFMRTRRHATGD